jgi:hypothetical protein
MLFEETTPTGKKKRLKWAELATWQKFAVVGGTGLVTYILYRGIKAVGGQKNVIKAPVDYGQIPQVYAGGTTGAPVLWNPDPLSKEIYENLDGGWNFNTYPETTDKITKLNDEQVKLLYNHYNAYYAEDYPTLTQLIENEWEDWDGSYARAVTRLKGLGLL